MSEKTATSSASGEYPSRGWQPIASAPRDGTAILAYEDGTLNDGEPHSWFDVVRFEQPHRGSDGWYSVGSYRGPPSCDPSHWMPLPAPPVALGTAARSDETQGGSAEGNGPARRATPTLPDPSDAPASGGGERDPDIILATAIWDANNTNRLVDIDADEIELAVGRARMIRHHLRVLGFDVLATRTPRRDAADQVSAQYDLCDCNIGDCVSRYRRCREDVR